MSQLLQIKMLLGIFLAYLLEYQFRDKLTLWCVNSSFFVTVIFKTILGSVFLSFILTALFSPKFLFSNVYVLGLYSLRCPFQKN